MCNQTEHVPSDCLSAVNYYCNGAEQRIQSSPCPFTLCRLSALYQAVGCKEMLIWSNLFQIYSVLPLSCTDIHQFCHPL